jgi:hypothetical protein
MALASRSDRNMVVNGDGAGDGRMMNLLDTPYTDAEIDEMIQIQDDDHDGQITFDEFVCMMLAHKQSST